MSLKRSASSASCRFPSSESFDAMESSPLVSLMVSGIFECGGDVSKGKSRLK